MANLTKDRLTDQLSGPSRQMHDPVAAATTLYRGAMAGLDASGDLVPAAPATPVMRGVVIVGVDNSDGLSGAVSGNTKTGTFRFDQTGLDRTHIESDVFVVDDQTVGAAGTLIAGKLIQLDAAGAWVEIA